VLDARHPLIACDDDGGGIDQLDRAEPDSVLSHGDRDGAPGDAGPGLSRRAPRRQDDVDEVGDAGAVPVH
jgi:hypothetical protein